MNQRVKNLESNRRIPIMAKQRSETVTEGKGGLVPWRPFGEMARWERDMERMLGNFFTGSGSLATREPNLNLDLYEEKDQIVVKAEMPGFTKDGHSDIHRGQRVNHQR
jgi:HSP20 family molecular chaperone IbpA